MHAVMAVEVALTRARSANVRMLACRVDKAHRPVEESLRS
jgi:predicted outer membrane protein